jgi:metallo-beta-lactamase family protein
LRAYKNILPHGYTGKNLYSPKHKKIFMKLKFYGAAGIVTGSCYRITTGDRQILIDCGMFQGTKKISKMSYDNFKFEPKKIDAVLLTHAHIDHSGLIPKLYKYGFRGKVYCTNATKDLCRIMLEDSAHLQEFETKWDNKRLAREGKTLRKPLYTIKEAQKCMQLFKSFNYDELIKIMPNIEIAFREAGHIVGSAIIEVFITEETTKKIVFSGDLGQENAPIIKDTFRIKTADYVLCESTYGGRVHENKKERISLIKKAMEETLKNNGKLIIPAFAIEKTQELIYGLNELAEKKQLPDIPIFVDSPLAMKATRIFEKHTENYDDDALNRIASGDNPFEFKNLKYLEKTEESKELNEYKKPCVIISASGMCTGGRIKHHLKNHIHKPNTIIFFVGYQAEGTLGRRIKDGEKVVKIYGENYPVKAKIMSAESFSSHADQPQLLKWLGAFETNPKVFFVHGEPESLEALKKAYGSGHIAKMEEEIEL